MPLGQWLNSEKNEPMPIRNTVKKATLLVAPCTNISRNRASAIRSQLKKECIIFFWDEKCYKNLGGLAQNEGGFIKWVTGGHLDGETLCNAGNGCNSFALCNGGADVFLYDKNMDSTEPLSTRTECTTYYSSFCSIHEN